MLPEVAVALDEVKTRILGNDAAASSPGESSLESTAYVLTSLHGEGGIGKTSMCKLLMVDDGVRSHFSGGLFWLEIGREASGFGVVVQIARLVDDCGGRDSVSGKNLSH